MPRIKVQVEQASGRPKTVTIDTGATAGATIGRDVFNADGTLFVPSSGSGVAADIRSGYGILISGATTKTINVNRAANFDWQGVHTWERPLQGPNGTAPLPAYTFGTDLDTGVYRVGADNLGISTGGTLRWDINSVRSLHAVPIYLPNGAVGAPALTFGTDTDTGVYRVGADNLGIATAGVLRWDINATRTLHAQPIYLPNGAVGAPALSFGTDTDIGLYRIGADNFGMSTNGVLRWDLNTARTRQSVPALITVPLAAGNVMSPAWTVANSTLSTAGGASLYYLDEPGVTYDVQTSFIFGSRGDFTSGVLSGNLTGFGSHCFGEGSSQALAGVTTYRFTRINATTGNGSTVFAARVDQDQLILVQGTAAIPSLSFIGDYTTGIYRGPTSAIAFSCSGNLRVAITNTEFDFNVHLRGQNGSATVPTYTFANDDNNGFYYITTDTFGLTTGGVLKLTFSTTAFTATLPWQGPNGSNTAPTFSFSGDTNTGMYSGGTDIIAFGTNSGLRFQIGAAGQWGIGGATYGSSGDIFISGGASSAPSWLTRTSLFANPTASVGLTAVNGSATTAMRSDAAPAIDQAITPTWTGTHTFTATYPNTLRLSGTALGLRWTETDASADGKEWVNGVNAGDYFIAAANDAFSTLRTALTITRGAASPAISLQQYGNSTDNPDHKFYGAMKLNSGLQNFVDDAAAAAGGIAVTQLYRNGSVVMIRVS